MRAIIHRKILTFFGSVMRRKQSLEREVICRQLVIKDIHSSSWVIQVREILHLYKLPDACSLMKITPPKATWKRMVKSSINTHWQERLKKEAAEKKTLAYVHLESCKVGQVHPVWRCGTDPLQVTMAATKARLLVQRYALAGTHCAGKNKRDNCPLCDGPPETLTHFLVDCPKLEDCRAPYIKKISSHLRQQNIKAETSEELLQVILDPSILPEEDAEIEEITRRLCFCLHNRRCVTLGSPSPFVTAISKWRKSGRY